MPDHRLFICDLRAYPEYDTAGAGKCFGVTLSCALSGNNGTQNVPIEQLLPWEIQPGLDLYFYYLVEVDIGGVKTPVWKKAVGVTLDALTKINAQDVQRLKDHHRATLSAFPQNEWLAIDLGNPDTIGKLPNYLARTSTEYPPLNFALKQAYCFRVDTNELVGASEFAAFLLPSGPVNDPVLDQGAMCVTGSSGAQGLDPDKAYSNALPAGQLLEGDYFSGSSLTGSLIRNGTNKPAFYSENWYARLNENARCLIDGGHIFLEACIDGDPEKNPTVDPAQAAAALCLSRDVAGLGLGPEPTANKGCAEGDDSLFGLVMREDAGSDAHELWTLLSSWENQHLSTAQEWLDFLRSDIAYPNLPPRIEDLTAKALSKLITDLAAPKWLHPIVATQWEKAIPDSVRWAPPLQELKRVLDAATTPPADDQAEPIQPSVRNSLRRSIASPLVEAARTNAEETPDKLARAIAAAYEAFLKIRLGPQSGTWPKTNYVPPAALLAKITARVTSLAQAFKPVLGATVPLEQPHGLTIQVDRIDATPNDKADFLRTVGGFFVLMRVKGQDKRWSWLNLAQPVLGSQPLGIEAIVSPSRIAHDESDRAIPFLTYDNQPLAAISPAIPKRARTVVAPLKTPTDQAQVELVIPDPVPATFQIPGLVYGRDYEIAFFARANSGILPKILSEAHPALPDLQFKGDLGDMAQDYSYRRRVPVGVWHIVPDETNSSGRLPELPSTLRPLAWEIWKESDSERPPLLLLAPANSSRQSFAATFRGPRTGLKNWDRWVAADAAMKADRIKYRAETTRIHDTYGTNGEQTDSPDLADPAVAQVVRISLKILHPVAAGPSPVFQMVGQDSFQIAFSTSENASIATVGNEVQVHTPAGTVCELLVDSLVTSSDFERFESSAFSMVNEVNHEGIAYKVCATNRLLIETARKLGGFTPADLMKSFQLEADRGKLTARLDPTAVSADFGNHLRDADKAILLSQQWRWQGSRTPKCPAQGKLNKVPLEADGASDCGALWDTWALPQMDLFTGKPVEVELWRVPSTPGQTRSLFQWSFDSETRALYRRVSLSVRSRYASIAGYDEEIRIADDALGPWKRAIVNARPATRLPRPALKALIPITNPKDQKPAILAVFHGSWYEEVGVAEKLVAKISSISTKPGTPTYLEAGFDPVRSVKQLDPADEFVFGDFDGPIGHSMDTATTDPLILNSSFIIPLPDALGGRPIPPESWFFARLQFRRSVHAEFVDAGTEASLESEWTAPEWVQFVPGKSLECPPVSLKASGVPDKLPEELFKTLRPLSPEPNVTDHALLVTRQIRDAFGRFDEAYVGTIYPDSANGAWKTDGLRPGSGEEVRVRVVEIFTRDQGAFRKSPKPFWERLFNATESISTEFLVREDVSGMMTRASNFIDVRLP